MNTETKTRMNVDEFVDWCDARASRWSGSDEPGWELYDGVPTMQDSERWAHVRVKAALYDVLRNAIQDMGASFELSIDGLGVRITERTAVVPDVVIFPAGLITDDDRFAPEPVVVAEVLSPFTTRLDLTTKLAGYNEVISIAHYLVLAPDAGELLHYVRQGGVLAPPSAPVTGELKLDPPGIMFKVEDCFRR